MTVAELGVRMDHSEYVTWLAYFAHKTQSRQVGA